MICLCLGGGGGIHRLQRCHGVYEDGVPDFTFLLITGEREYEGLWRCSDKCWFEGYEYEIYS
jgi:hypothetical protein